MIFETVESGANHDPVHIDQPECHRGTGVSLRAQASRHLVPVGEERSKVDDETVVQLQEVDVKQRHHDRSRLRRQTQQHVGDCRSRDVKHRLGRVPHSIQHADRHGNGKIR